MLAFFEAGVSCFDCADIYTGVETLIGEFLRRLRLSHGEAAAGSLRVHTKYVPDLAALPRLTRRDVEGAVDRALRRLGVERLDLVQLHWWDYAVPGFVEAGLALSELRRAGKLREVGATNFDVPRLAALLDAGVPLASHQVQYSIVDRRPENGMTSACRERGIALLAYGALLGGFLSEAWLGAAEPRPPLENRSLTKYKLVLEEFGDWASFQRLLEALAAVASKHAVGIGAVGLRWVLERPGVAAVIVGARNARRLPATLAALSLRLDAEDHERIATAARGAAGPRGDCYALERTKGGRHAAIMRYDLNAAAQD
jgi:aryl-alcohol dehydrogenase-like predicted oxidoreductase